MKNHFVPATDCVEWQAAPRSLPVVTVKLGWLPHQKIIALYVIPNRRAGARGQGPAYTLTLSFRKNECWKKHKSLRLDTLASPICPKWKRKWEEWLGDHDFNYHFETDVFWYCLKHWIYFIIFFKTLSNRHKDHY